MFFFPFFFTNEPVGDEQGSVAPPVSHKSLSQALDEAVSREMRCLWPELAPACSGNMDSVPHRGSSAAFSAILYLDASVTGNQPTCTSTCLLPHCLFSPHPSVRPSICLSVSEFSLSFSAVGKFILNSKTPGEMCSQSPVDYAAADKSAAVMIMNMIFFFFYDYRKERQSKSSPGVIKQMLRTSFHRLSFAFLVSVVVLVFTSLGQPQVVSSKLVLPTRPRYQQTNRLDNCKRRKQTSTPGKFSSKLPQSAEKKTCVSCVYICNTYLHESFSITPQ